MRLGPLAVSLLLVLTLFSGCLHGEVDDGEGSDREFPPFPGDDDEDGGPLVWAKREDALIRPGAPIEGGCVFNWLFVDNASNAYIGTAAHCTSLGVRLKERDSGVTVGEVVFDSDDSAGADPELDFALVRLDREAVGLAHPAMLGFEAPTGVMDPGKISAGDWVAFYGHGFLFGDEEESRARMGLIVSSDDRVYRANMPAVEGDSGSPVIHWESGQALGMVARYGVWDILDGEVPTTDVGPLMAWVLDELGRAGFELELATV